MRFGAMPRPDVAIHRGGVAEREQLGRNGGLGRYEQKVTTAPQQEQRHGVTYVPYGEAMDIIREVDDELTAEYDERGERRDKGMLLEGLQDKVAEYIDEWLIRVGYLRENQVATRVTARNSLQTALDVYHGIDAFLDVEIPGLYRRAITLDVTKNAAKLRGEQRAKADLVIQPIHLPDERRRPKDPAEVAAWRDQVSRARAEVAHIAKRVAGMVLADVEQRRRVRRA